MVMDQETLISFFTDILGEVPPEFEGFMYIIEVFVLLFVIDQLFCLLTSIFGVTKWK